MDGKSEYEAARKKGLKSFNNHKFNGENPYLPALDAILSHSAIVSEVYLGRMEIPIKKIKGTKTVGRQKSFAPNFMPILSMHTEFGSKWSSLCKAHVQEGIRDDIKVYEYLNWFYVEEGNKRVSVLKYHEAVMVGAQVTRLVPKYDKDDEVVVSYYEFMDFFKKTRVNYLWMTDQEGYKKLYLQMKKYGWAEENSSEFMAFYFRFRRVYYEIGGNDIPITTGDALLRYLEIYAYQEELSNEDIKKQLNNMRSEFALLGEGEQVDLQVSTESLEKKSIFDGITNFSSSMKKARIAFIHSKNREDSGWTYGHEIGRQHVENVFGKQIETKVFLNVPEDERAYDAIVAAVKEGFDIVFTTSPTYMNSTLKAAVEYKDVKFLNCSESLSSRNVRTYFGRIYEPNFLVGMIAGAMTKTNILGYVVTYPIPEVISAVNAFTLGARFVNPFAQVMIKWVERNTEEQGAQIDVTYDVDCQLVDMGVDIISHQESSDLNTMLKNSGIYMVTSCEKEEHQYLATPVWNWGEFYERIIRNIMSGAYSRLNNSLGANDKAINYWWGMDAEVVDVFYSRSALPREIQQTVDFMKEMIVNGSYHPFRGPIYDQKKKLRLSEGENLEPNEILNMNWFVEGVIGSIPAVMATESTDPLMELMSVKKKYE